MHAYNISINCLLASHSACGSCLWAFRSGAFYARHTHIATIQFATEFRYLHIKLRSKLICQIRYPTSWAQMSHFTSASE